VGHFQGGTSGWLAVWKSEIYIMVISSKSQMMEQLIELLGPTN
jgi:hypothetical protein